MKTGKDVETLLGVNEAKTAEIVALRQCLVDALRLMPDLGSVTRRKWAKRAHELIGADVLISEKAHG